MLSIDPKPEAAWPERLFRAQFRRLVGLFAGYRPKAGGCQAGIFFRGTFPKAGVAFRRGSSQSWRRPGLNVFSEHNSEGWWDFSQRIDPKLKAVWRKYFFGVHFQRLEWLFAEDLPKAGGSLELYFFGLSQRATWGASRSVWKGSRKRTGVNIFPGYISEGWRDFLQRIDPKPKAVWSCTFSGYRSGSLGEPRDRCRKAAGSGRALKLF